MARFTAQNTEGYSQADLAELNRMFDIALAKFGDLSEFADRKSVEDHVAEEVLADFDLLPPLPEPHD